MVITVYTVKFYKKKKNHKKEAPSAH